MKKYMDIERLKDGYMFGFRKGDSIIIQEKIDGANFSIRYDAETDTVASYSRKMRLKMANNLRGAWEWANALNKELVKSVLGTNFILFGEWLVPHTINYPDEKYQNAYFYDVWDTERNQYLEQDKVKEIVEKLGLIYVPVFYEGTFESWEHIMEFVGKTELGGEIGEGIVVKNMTRLNDSNTRLPFYVKIVIEKFSEIKPVRKEDVEKLERNAKIYAIVESVITEGRVTKMIHKMVDEGIIPTDWNKTHMSIIGKQLGIALYEDCEKEEPEVVDVIGEEFARFANKIGMKMVYEMVFKK